ncbi:MAG TPA: CpsD/CapB family tyrosine-protein kinase [Anaerolineae bacterium]|nr:CpsD/CapB family tyrosine-protein kinase [Anaerolineae bacterium]
MPQPDLVTLTEPRSPVSEAYRTLRTNLEFSSLDHPLHSLLVTTPADNADKIKTLANLAVIMAEGGRRVILVDSDLRRPELHTVFGVDNSAGLSELLRSTDDRVEPPLRETGVESLQLLTSGQLPQNPSVLLGADRMRSVLDTLTSRADLVLLNAPPVLAVTDATLLASQVDGTLLVLRARGTQREHVQRAQALLQKVSAHLIGAVLSNASLDSSITSYYK